MDWRVNPPRQVPRLHVKTPLRTSCKEGMKLCGNYGYSYTRFVIFFPAE